MAWTKEYKRKTQEIICEECGRTAEKPVAEVKRGGGRFCGRPCAWKNNAKNRDMRGEKNPNFKDWASRNKVEYRKTQEKRYPEKARARKKTKKPKGPRKCQICEATGQQPKGKIQQHHDSYEPGREQDTFDLCKPHHDRVGEITGKGNNFIPDISQEAIRMIIEQDQPTLVIPQERHNQDQF